MLELMAVFLFGLVLGAVTASPTFTAVRSDARRRHNAPAAVVISNSSPLSSLAALAAAAPPAPSATARLLAA